MKQIVTGIVAHVDAGKTTLSEALLYQGGALQKLGRVDNQDAFLDSDELEKRRGITIFSHQAQVQFQDLLLTLLDTPGHVDFAAQTEQVLSVLDYAILVISGTDGIQGYTRTLWRLLTHYQIPTFIFVNKMDVAQEDAKRQILDQLQTIFAPGCLDFTPEDQGYQLSEATSEAIAMEDDGVLATYLETGILSDQTVQQMIQKRQIFPCYFGTALKLTGIDAFLAGMTQWAKAPIYPSEFGAKVFKITYDEKGDRLTWLRLTGGRLQTKDMLFKDQKVNQFRIYNGTKFEIVPEVSAGMVCAIPGLKDTYPGQGLGKETSGVAPIIQPVLNYTVLPQKEDLHTCLKVLRQLEDEDPQLHVSWSNQLQEIRVQIMGTVQLEVLQQILVERFGLKIGFSTGSILYKETITQSVEGVGHFEPLRHYSEVHLLMEPTAPGTGRTFESQCSFDVLDHNWQNQVLSNLTAKTHLGVLIGAPITDMKITLIGGRASNVHSVGGDFKEATWRAVRQGLMMLRQVGKCALLEPWYRFRLEVPQAQIGRAMNDIQRMHGQFEPPETKPTTAILTGTAPVSEMQDYSREVYAYSHGQGQLECSIEGYRPCHNTEAVLAQQDYQPVSDLENTPDSVFCAHGAGYPVPWNQVPEAAHCPYQLTPGPL